MQTECSAKLFGLARVERMPPEWRCLTVNNAPNRGGLFPNATNRAIGLL